MSGKTTPRVETGIPSTAAVHSLLNQAYEGWGTQEHFHWKYNEYPGYSPADHAFHVMIDGELGAFRRLFERELAAEAGTVPVAVLGDTAVSPAYRGRGLYSKLHSRTMEYSRENGAERAITFNRQKNVTFEANRDRGWGFATLPLQLRIISPTTVLPSYTSRLVEDDATIEQILELVGHRIDIDVSNGRIPLAELLPSADRSITDSRSLGIGLTDRALARLTETAGRNGEPASRLGLEVLKLVLSREITPFRTSDGFSESLRRTYDSLRLSMQNELTIVPGDDVADRTLTEICDLFDRSQRTFRRSRADVRHMLRYPDPEAVIIKRDGTVTGVAILGSWTDGQITEGRVLDVVTDRQSDYWPLMAAVERRAIERGSDIVVALSKHDLGDYWARIDRQVVMWKSLSRSKPAQSAVDARGISLYDVI